MPEKRLIDQETLLPTRKVWAMIWVAVGVVVLLVLLIIVRTFLVPEDPALDSLINALGTAIPFMISGTIAAWFTREEDTPHTPET